MQNSDLSFETGLISETVSPTVFCIFEKMHFTDAISKTLNICSQIVNPLIVTVHKNGDTLGNMLLNRSTQKPQLFLNVGGGPKRPFRNCRQVYFRENRAAVNSYFKTCKNFASNQFYFISFIQNVGILDNSNSDEILIQYFSIIHSSLD